MDLILYGEGLLAGRRVRHMGRHHVDEDGKRHLFRVAHAVPFPVDAFDRVRYGAAALVENERRPVSVAYDLYALLSRLSAEGDAGLYDKEYPSPKRLRRPGRGMAELRRQRRLQAFEDLPFPDGPEPFCRWGEELGGLERRHDLFGVIPAEPSRLAGKGHAGKLAYLCGLCC